jgi:hypothetical protein
MVVIERPLPRPVASCRTLRMVLEATPRTRRSRHRPPPPTTQNCTPGSLLPAGPRRSLRLSLKLQADAAMREPNAFAARLTTDKSPRHEV